MTTRTNSLDGSSIRRAVLILTAAVALSACGSTEEAETTTAPEAATTESTDSVPGALAIADASEDVSEDAPIVSDAAPQAVPTTVPESVDSTVAPTTTLATSPTTTEAETVSPRVLEPSEVEGSSGEDGDLVAVSTSPGDPLNVRTAPGVGNPIVDTLLHETPVTVTHGAVVESGAVWAYVSYDGEPVGWVNASFLVGPNSTVCQAARDSRPAEDLMVTVEADVDADGIDDTVGVYAVEAGNGTWGMWVEVDLSRGGDATGLVVGGLASSADLPGFIDVRVTNLTRLPDREDPAEIMLVTSQGASHSTWIVLAVTDCIVTPTTLDGEVFSLANGATGVRSSSAGCSYGAHEGLIDFTRSFRNFETQEWSRTHFELRGTEWTEFGTRSSEDENPFIFPATVSTPEDCAGASASGGLPVHLR